jgi:hypothetical protein
VNPRTVDRCSAALLLLLLLLPGAAARAHDTPIAVLTLTEKDSGLFVAGWNFQSSKGLPPPTVEFPSQCTLDPPQLDCGPAGLVGSVKVLELGEKYSGVVIRVERVEGGTASYTLTGGNDTVTFASGGLSSVGALTGLAASYTGLGVEHIMLGVDHLLFVLGLIWLVRSRWMLVKTITAFTVAHSITLAAATFGWVLVAERTVNAAIALSIAVVAVEVVRLQRGEATWSARHPWSVAFGFGLLHGFGFAGALTRLGLTPEAIPWALLFFNVGVELGQLAFVVTVLALAWAHRSLAATLPRRAEAVPVYAVGVIGAVWFLQRVEMIVA